jgi:hypothetical protein
MVASAARAKVETWLPTRTMRPATSTVDRTVTLILLTACTASTATSLPYGEPDK